MIDTVADNHLCYQYQQRAKCTNIYKTMIHTIADNHLCYQYQQCVKCTNI